jgi:hypothetical protein
MEAPLVSVCAHCYKEHGLPAPPNASHGICRRHAKEMMRQMGWPEEKIERHWGGVSSETGAPDLGPVNTAMT